MGGDRSRRPWRGGRAGRSLPLLLAALLPGLPGATCDGSPTLPDDAAEVRIRLAVTGGLAGVDWAYVVDGEDGLILGERCAGTVGCDWESGEVLAAVSPAEILALAREFVESGFPELEREDYGVECCDQFEYALTYRDGDEEKTVTGSDGTLPDEVLALADAVRRFVEEARDGT